MEAVSRSRRLEGTSTYWVSGTNELSVEMAALKLTIAEPKGQVEATGE